MSGFRRPIDHLEIFIPLDRRKPLQALNGMADVVRRGGSLLVYPEGVVSHTEGELAGVQEGAAHVAILTSAPLVPGGHDGRGLFLAGKASDAARGAALSGRRTSWARAGRAARGDDPQLAAAMRALLPGEAPSPAASCCAAA